MLGDVKLPYNNSKRNTTGMGHNCLHIRFFLLDLDLRSVDLDLDLPSLKRTWTRTWTCSLKVDLDLDLRIVDLDLDLDFTVAGLVTSLLCKYIREVVFQRFPTQTVFCPSLYGKRQLARASLSNSENKRGLA